MRSFSTSLLIVYVHVCFHACDLVNFNSGGHQEESCNARQSNIKNPKKFLGFMKESMCEFVGFMVGFLKLVFEQRVFETAPTPCWVSQWFLSFVTMVLKKSNTCF
jgi:hypothetical protein